MQRRILLGSRGVETVVLIAEKYVTDQIYAQDSFPRYSSARSTLPR